MSAARTGEIVERVRGGDVEAFAEIVRLHQDDVWRTVAFALRDVQTTEDLVQQTFVNAYGALGRFDTSRELGPWLRTIARNLVREELRRSARADRRLEGYRAHLDQQDDTAADSRQAELHAALSRCREELSESAQAALALRYDDGMGFQEIADRMDRTLAATRQLLQRVRASLRVCIEAGTGVSS